ncbi:hypothetical protein AYO20_05416 [Fonsecaea nubica]|uniref:Uncharacterized protein n=1 Tax=Fonsecaea nubica TaxID=856822 RepID=A0A178D2Q4_9EURO|nr:hypothetical protein AYO20_05416 [Fonsecaea nubica]OAL35365.1 hypothetical protein AYO20_05416 [Fonsecaea nubica]
MDKLKTMMDKGNVEDKTGPSSRLTGQGSHFPKNEEQPVGAATGLQENIAVGDTRGTDIQQARGGNLASQLPGRGPGTAAIGETSTYSSHTLRTGDPVPNVVDFRSEDPATYQAPEHSYVSSRGIPEGGPLAAAAHAFHKDKDYSTSHLPGAFPNDTTAHDATTIAPSTLTTTTSPAERSAVYGEAEKTKVPDAAAAAQFATRAAPGTQEPVSEEPRSSGTIGKILGAVGLGTAASGAMAATSRAEEDQQHAVADTPNQPTTTTGVDSYTSPSHSGHPSSHHRKESIPTTAYPAGVDSPAPISPPIGGTSATSDQEEKDHAARNTGLAAGAAGVGAGVAAAGVYSMRGREQNTAETDWPLRNDTTAATPATATVPPSEGATKTTPVGQTARQPHTAYEAAPATTETSIVSEYRQPQERPEAQTKKDKAKQEATRATPTSAEGGASRTSEYSKGQDMVSEEIESRRHKKEKEAALAGVAGAGAGAGAAGLYEHNKRQDGLEDDTQRQKDLAEQEAARQKQFEKDQKAAEKQAKKEEKQHQKEIKKEEKQHQKELEKQEKHHQKEIETEEKHHQKEVDKETAAREKAAEKEERHRREELEHDQKEREKATAAAAAGAGAGVATGAGAYEVHDKDRHPPPTTVTDESGRTKLHKEPEEKKPGLLKRIFKRRKNKDTGEEEEYEDHDHDEPEAEHGDHHIAEAGVVGGTGAAVAGAAASSSHEPPASSYEVQSGGLQKPSYNPFSKDDPAHEHPTTSSAH